MPLSVSCPGCREPLDVDDEYRTWKVRCPRCDTEFVPDEPRRPRPRDDEDFRPRRRRRSRFDAEDFRDAAAEAHGPSVFLEFLGWLGLVLCVGLAILFVVVGLAPKPAARQGQQAEDLFFMVVFGGCFGVLGTGFNAVIIIGARHLRRLSSRPWAMAAAIVAMLTSGLLHLAAGVWALVVIHRAHVGEAFDYYAEHGRPPDDDD